MKTFTIHHRKAIEVNTDPQRRCYNGCHFSSELQWTAWRVLELEVPEDRIQRRLKFWRELNDYAVSQRGESAKCEFEAEEDRDEGYLVIHTANMPHQMLALNVREDTVRKILTNIGPEKCDVYCTTNMFELPMNGTEWMLDNPSPKFISKFEDLEMVNPQPTTEQ